MKQLKGKKTTHTQKISKIEKNGKITYRKEMYLLEGMEQMFL